MPKEMTNRVVLYKLNPGFDLAALGLAKKKYSLEYSDKTTKLFIQADRISPPQWLRYIKPLLPPARKLRNKNASFIFFVKHKKNHYAICGGYGYTELADHIVEDFGLQIVLRMINDISIINQQSMKGVTRQILRAVSGYDPNFDRENYNRILSSLEGKAIFEDRKFRVKGSSSLVLRTVRDIKHITEVLNEVEEIMGRAEIVHFPKSYEEVKKPKIIAALEEQMLEKFNAFWKGQGDRDHFYLEFKDPLIQFRCDKFELVYKRHTIEIEDFDLDLVRSHFSERGIKNFENVDQLKKVKVSGISESGIREVKDEPLLNMLVSELTYAGSHYIKFGKRWYKILDEISEYLNHELKKLPINKALLPPWDRAKFPTENDYNKFVSDQKGWHCLDKDCIQLEGHSKVELCDIYDAESRRFFHIKETWGCKSAYLFTQGTIAAESYRQSQQFRKECAKKWPGLFKQEIQDATLVFGIGSNKAFEAGFPINMTYFAKLNLFSAVALLKQFDYSVMLSPIEMQTKI